MSKTGYGPVGRKVARSQDTTKRQSSSLASDLSGLESYLAQGGSSADPAFLKLQIQYLISASSRVQANAALLERRLGATVDTASSLRNPQ